MPKNALPRARLAVRALSAGIGACQHAQLANTLATPHFGMCQPSAHAWRPAVAITVALAVTACGTLRVHHVAQTATDDNVQPICDVTLHINNNQTNRQPRYMIVSCSCAVDVPAHKAANGAWWYRISPGRFHTRCKPDSRKARRSRVMPLRNTDSVRERAGERDGGVQVEDAV